ncbi:16717_t:CDS:1 [Dentiscutata heterogama]|uniref:16717_t:CDS:1 n=1 Tax=Dentiscutata heterogama TaxID=1316150 RepID=A0ACA9QS71_9GLOM|nr:16717_t:CDS:1 [Dentiscutata heterogama]
MEPYENQLPTVDENKNSIIERSDSHIEKNNKNSNNRDSVTESPSTVEATAVVGENEDAASFQAENSTTTVHSESDTIVELPVIEDGAPVSFQAENSTAEDHFESDTVVEPPFVEYGAPTIDIFPYCPIEFPENTPLLDQYVRELTSLLQ